MIYYCNYGFRNEKGNKKRYSISNTFWYCILIIYRIFHNRSHVLFHRFYNMDNIIFRYNKFSLNVL